MDKIQLFEHMKDVFTLIHPELMVKKTAAAEADNEDRKNRVQEWLKGIKEAVSQTQESPWGAEGNLTSFHLLPTFIKMLKECILNHQWSQVLTMLNCVSHIPYGADWSIWKATMAALYTEPEENMQLIQDFFRHTYLLKECHVVDMALEFVQYLFSQGFTQDALQVIQSTHKQRLVVLSNRRKSAVLQQGTRNAFTQQMLILMDCYQSLIYYIDWKAAVNRKNKSPQSQLSQSFYELTASQGLSDEAVRSMADSALLGLDSLVEKSGAWDMFITKSVEIHEFYEEFDAARTILRKYRDRNPDNPNSHKFLYEYLMKNKEHLEEESVNEESLDCLKSLAKVDPANPEIFMLWKTLKDQGANNEALCFIFDLLDFEIWQNRSKGWKCLSKSLTAGLSINKHVHEKEVFLKALEQCWSTRKDWWPIYHFMDSGLNAHIQSSSCEKRLVKKAIVASILLGKGNSFSKKVREMVTDSSCRRLDHALSNVDWDMLSNLTGQDGSAPATERSPSSSGPESDSSASDEASFTMSKKHRKCEQDNSIPRKRQRTHTKIISESPAVNNIYLKEVS